jgi:hypothetical protein
MENINKIEIDLSKSKDVNEDYFYGKNVDLILYGFGNLNIKNVTASKLKINLSGKGNISIDNCQAEDVDVILSGSGGINIKGRIVSKLKINLCGNGYINTEDYQAENVDATISGMGVIKIWVTNSVDGKIFGKGDIFYKGNPKRNISITGAGEVKPL